MLVLARVEGTVELELDVLTCAEEDAVLKAVEFESFDRG